MFLSVDNAMNVPQLSIIIASHNAGSVLTVCLAALEKQAGRETVEIIVADSSSDGTADEVCARFPDVRLMRFSQPLTIPQLRGAGIAAARGDLVAILDPYCIVDGRWLTELIRLHAERPEVVIGGAVVLGDDGPLNLGAWATYLGEYAAFMPPLAGGPAHELTGNNLVYKRQALALNTEVECTGFWKAFFNHQLQSQGYELWSAPSLVVKLHKPIPWGQFFRSRYHHGRCFAAMRVADAPRSQRYLRLLTVPLLPYLALWRQLRSFWPKRRHRKQFVLALPLLFLFHLSWAWGELWGYMRGPGRSCEQLFY